MNSQKSFAPTDSGKLYLVPTPIGNLEDMTFRAVRQLKEVDKIAAEDTRNTQKLLNHFDIHTPQLSFHEHNWRERVSELVNEMKKGQSIAQVSDAGMPSISDPGYELVRAAITEGIPVIPLPGASAGITALIASGLLPQPFYFYGFLPRKKKEQQEAVEELNKHFETIILYESPHRLKQTLQTLQKVMGNERRIVLARELTKRYEEFLRGTLEEAIRWTNETEVRGEFCLILQGNSEPIEEEAEEWANWTLKEHVDSLIQNQNLSSKEAIKQVAVLRKVKKREVYAAYHEI